MGGRERQRETEIDRLRKRQRQTERDIHTYRQRQRVGRCIALRNSHRSTDIQAAK